MENTSHTPLKNELAVLVVECGDNENSTVITIITLEAHKLVSTHPYRCRRSRRDSSNISGTDNYSIRNRILSNCYQKTLSGWNGVHALWRERTFALCDDEKYNTNSCAANNTTKLPQTAISSSTFRSPWKTLHVSNNADEPQLARKNGNLETLIILVYLKPLSVLALLYKIRKGCSFLMLLFKLLLENII